MSYFFILCVVLIPAVCSFLIAGKRDGGRLCMLVVLAGIFFLGVLWQVDEAIPFAGAGDDKDYFNASKRSFNSVSDCGAVLLSTRREQLRIPSGASKLSNIAGRNVRRTSM